MVEKTVMKHAAKIGLTLLGISIITFLMMSEIPIAPAIR